MNYPILQAAEQAYRALHKKYLLGEADREVVIERVQADLQRALEPLPPNFHHDTEIYRTSGLRGLRSAQVTLTSETRS